MPQISQRRLLMLALAGFMAMVVVIVVRAMTSAPPPVAVVAQQQAPKSVEILTATRDIPTGAILKESDMQWASWASDAASVTSNPALRELPGSHRMVSIDEVLEALSALDHRPKGPPGGKPMRMKSVARANMAA